LHTLDVLRAIYVSPFVSLTRHVGYSDASGHQIACTLVTLRVDTLQLKEATAMAANPVLAIEEQDRYTHEEKSEPEEVLALRQRVKKALDKVFAGHEEYLGCTPD
jgi:hypothetical protein